MFCLKLKFYSFDLLVLSMGTSKSRCWNSMNIRICQDDYFSAGFDYVCLTVSSAHGNLNHVIGQYVLDSLE